MNTGVTELLAFGSVAVITGIFFIVSMVRELAPAQRRNWLLGIGLSAGVIAFSLKIALIVIFGLFSDSILALFPERRYDNTATLPDAFALTDQKRPDMKKTGYIWEALPEAAPFPQDNPTTPEKIQLGKKLFFDKRLSGDGSVSCASCHELSAEKAGGDGLATSIGIHGQRGNRSAPSVLNAAFQRVLFWDGRAASLEEQAKGPLVNPVEMGMPSLESVEQQVQGIAEYQREFAQVFGKESSITIDNIAKAIAAYERTLITPDSSYDRFVKGDSSALTEKQLRGMALFEATGCISCHSGPNFSGASVFGENAPYRIFPALPGSEYETRYHFTEDQGLASEFSETDRGVWRIPSLRNVSRTAPYFHNGSVDSLEEAVRIMARVQLNKHLSNSTSDDKMIHWVGADRQLRVVTNQALSDAEVDAIVAFLETLDGELPNE